MECAFDLKNHIALSEHAIKSEGYDFIGKYMAMGDLHALAKSNPEVISYQTVDLLKITLQNPSFLKETQALFFYKETADTLASIILNNPSEPIKIQAMSVLKNLLRNTSGHQQRAIAEAMGSLPVMIQGPLVHETQTEVIPEINLEGLLEKTGIKTSSLPSLLGRSMVYESEKLNKLLVIKFANNQDSYNSLQSEAVWIEHFGEGFYQFPLRFNIPEVIKVKGSCVFKLSQPETRLHKIPHLHPEAYAIAFYADRDYFSYPNESMPKGRIPIEVLQEVLFRNALLLGRLTSLGIVHSAPIPLFHNRLQRDRRADRGIYEWQRGGRLDRWLDSCRHPNFGLSGIRDFEHFIVLTSSGPKLYIHIGSHVLSLLLVAASYFRNKDTSKIGFDEDGKPYDVRYLFEKPLLVDLIHGIFSNYYHGFVGKQFKEDDYFDLESLAERMIEEMGVDRHMEEILRITDQERLEDGAFKDFLLERGFSKEEVASLRKGAQDITMLTGPHLGEFNQAISIPELIEFLGAVSALCIAGKYLEEKGFNSPSAF